MSQFAFRLNRIAVVGTVAVSMAGAVSGFGIVRAERGNPDNSKTFSCSSGTACVEGNASGSATNGVYGSSIGKGTHAVYGTSDWDGVAAHTTSTTGGAGVSGVSTSKSGSANGVYGSSSNGSGVFGQSSIADGIFGITTASSDAGVYGYSKGNGNGVFAVLNSSSSTYTALQAYGDNSNTWLFYAYNRSTGGTCTINPKAALYCSGGVGGSALRTRHRNSSGRRVLTYAAESASATIEDFGTARMFGGVANVQIDPAFASVMDHRWYYVFLTPLGDTRGLYVSVQTPAAFAVRETEHGRSTLSFDYRIVAHPLDAKDDRLPLAPDLRRPPEPLHSAQ